MSVAGMMNDQNGGQWNAEKGNHKEEVGGEKEQRQQKEPGSEKAGAHSTLSILTLHHPIAGCTVDPSSTPGLPEVVQHLERPGDWAALDHLGNTRDPAPAGDRAGSGS